MKWISAGACVLFGLAAGACSQTPVPSTDLGPEAPVVRGLQGEVGPSGGTLSGAGLTLVVPPGALSGTTHIEVVATDLPAPAGYRLYTPVYRASPEGLRFARPAVLTLEFAGDPARARLYWSLSGATGYESLGGTVAGNLLTASVQHFSTGFVGTEEVDTPDASVDAGHDVSADLSPDTPTDEGTDVPSDQALEAAADAGFDASADLPADTLSDGGTDVPSDRAPEAAADAPSDVSSDAGVQRCPATPPDDGLPGPTCEFPELVCSYPQFDPFATPPGIWDPRPGCRRSTHRCSPPNASGQSLWYPTESTPCLRGTVTCQSEAAMRAGASCSQGDFGLAWCPISDGTCYCMLGRFECDDPTRTPGCPPHPPPYGYPCMSDGLLCSYRLESLVCRRGTWQPP